MFALETLARDYVKVNGNYYIVDTIKAMDTRKWETGLAKVDMEELLKDWYADGETDCPPTDDDIFEWCEDYADGWAVEQHPNIKVARKRHKEICKTAELKGDDDE